MGEEKMSQEASAEVKESGVISPEGQKTTEIQSSSESKHWLRPLLYSISGIILAAGLVFIGYKLGQTRQVAVKPSPAMSPTPFPSPTPIPTSTPTPNSTANWETFHSRKLNYEIKYPPEITLEGPPSGAPDYYDDVSFSIIGEKGKSGHMVDGLNINMRTEENSQELGLRDWVKNKYSEGYPLVINTIDNFSIAGLNAVRVLGQGMYPFDEVIILQEKKVLIIQGSYVGSNEQKYKEIYNIMLSTFKFLD